MLTVRVTGEDRVQRAFRTMGLRVRDLSAAWNRIGAAIRRTAVPLTPVKTGALVASLRQGATKTQAVVRMGGRGVVYAGVQNYGWPQHNIAAKHFLNTALLANRDTAEHEITSEIDRLARRVGLS